MSVSRMGSDQQEDDKNLGGKGEWNVILWADHRAEEEAEVINSTGEGVLGFVGKTMSVSLILRYRGEGYH
jgi:ribulose kinase